MTDTDVELNELLKKAREAQSSWEMWELEGIYDRSPEWKALYRSARDAWGNLHKAILKSAPCNFHLENGKTRRIGTVGMLTADLMMYYSENFDARYTVQGTNLKLVVRIEKGENK